MERLPDPRTALADFGRVRAGCFVAECEFGKLAAAEYLDRLVSRCPVLLTNNDLYLFAVALDTLGIVRIRSIPYVPVRLTRHR
jgi:hypothetical protein